MTFNMDNHQSEAAHSQGAKKLPDSEMVSRNQSLIAAKLVRSKQEIPDYYLKTNLIVCNLLDWRLANKRSDGKKYSTTSVIINAVSKCLVQIPKLNAYFVDNKVFYYSDVNIGVAVSSGDELFIPVIKNADTKSIAEIDSELLTFTEKAKTQTFEEDDLLGATFTIASIGAYGIEEFNAIINPLQAGILAIGAIRKVLNIEEKESIRIRNMVTVTAGFDHRFVNGWLGAEFLNLFKNIIENEFKTS